MTEWWEFNKDKYASEKEHGLTDKQKSIFRLLNQRVMMGYYTSESNQVYENERVKREIDYNREQSVVITDV